MSLVPDPDLDIRKPSFHEKFLYYLKKNARPKLSLKLMQASSYFCFREFPFFVIKELTNVYWRWQNRALGDDKSLQDIDLENLEKPLWITNKLDVWHGFSRTGIASELIPKFAVCDLKVLWLGDQTLTLKEFEFLVSSKSVEDFLFLPGQVKYPDDSIVPVDEVVKLLPNLKLIEWQACHMPLKIREETTKNLIANLNPSILRRFCLWGISEVFDFTLFSKFMDKHPTIRFDLSFNGPPISENYSTMLQTYVNKLVESGEYKNRLIRVCFPGEKKEYHIIMDDHYYADY